MTHPTHDLDSNALEAAPKWPDLAAIEAAARKVNPGRSEDHIKSVALDALSIIRALSQNPGPSNTSGEAEPVAWRWRFPPGGWHYASEKPEFAPYDAERVHGPFPMYAALEPRASDRGAEFTYGHCEERKKPGGCQLHNLHCGYPDCDRRAIPKLSEVSHE